MDLENLPLGELTEYLAELPQDQFYATLNELSTDALEMYYSFLLSQVEKGKIEELVEKAAEDSPEGFAAYYELITSTKLPDHAHGWVDQIYGDKENNKGTLTFAFRGSWKTSVISVGFTSFRIGKDPQRANLVVQASDSSAKDIGNAVARIIEHHPGWKRVYPHIVPDKEAGWSGEKGYEVKDTSMPYSEWTTLNTSRKDPTLLSLGITSTQLIGKHPDGVFIWDDLHDEENSTSQKERTKVVRILTDTMMPMSVTEPTDEGEHKMVTWELPIGTPWDEEDAYHYLRATNAYGFNRTPIMRHVGKEVKGAVYFDEFEDIQGWWIPTWRERFPRSAILSLRSRMGQRGFARMYLLDISKSKETGIKFMTFPNEMIDLGWISSGGIDYASIIEVKNRPQDFENRSEFAFAWGHKLPTGGAVITDGVIGHYTQLQGENFVEQTQKMLPNYQQTAVEMNGVGEQFYAVLTRKPHLSLLPFWTGRAAKPKRIENIVAPALEMGLLKISDADTPFLNKLRKSLQDFPYGNDDILDAVYAFMQTMPDAFTVPDPRYNQGDGVPYTMRGQEKRNPNPFSAFGKN